jgi:hypothetical protein
LDPKNSKLFGSGILDEKSVRIRIRKKHPGSATTLGHCHKMKRLQFAPFYMQMIKINRSGARTRQAAGHDNLELRTERTEIRRHSFFVRILQKWNSLPDEIKKTSSVEEFKKRLKNHKMRPV